MVCSPIAIAPSLTRRAFLPRLASLVASEEPLSGAQKRRRHDGRLPFPLLRRPRSTAVVRTRAPFAGCVCSSRASAARSLSGDSGKESHEDGINACQLFREIGDRVSVRSAKKDRKPGESVSSNLQRKSAASLTSEFCESYLSISESQLPSWNNYAKKEFIDLLLNNDYDVDKASILSAIGNVRSSGLREADISRIRDLCTPPYECIFQYILGSAREDLGVAFLVSLRRDIRDMRHYWKYSQQEEGLDGAGLQHDAKGISSQHLAKLQILERSIQTILASLFRPGVLNLERITYQDTPAAIIEQIAFKEAVHPLQSLQDLRTRLGPGRRCFAFFHPALPHKPLVFVHVALLREMPKGMSDLRHAAESDATCATFYSITNTEPGLAGVDLGNHLIKSVVRLLKEEFPTLDVFCTLSPIPKFVHWLEGKVVQIHDGLLRRQQSSHDGIDGGPDYGGLLGPAEVHLLKNIFPSDTPLLDLVEALKSPKWRTTTPEGGTTLEDRLQLLLMKLAAYYLVVETKQGRPLCPVAKFHIRNGAEMFRLNYMADDSPKGLRNSCGMMINYRYVLDEIEGNRDKYEVSNDISVQDGVRNWLNMTEENS
ncbi:hypothetical protein ACHAWF_018542 [Thalassiosira exigua]